MKTIITAMTLMTAASQATAAPAGLRLTKIEMPHHDGRASVSIWYPNGGGGDETVFAENPEFAGRIDTSRIMAAGFSYGGWTALSMGGLRGNHQGIIETCTRFIDTMSATSTRNRMRLSYDPPY